MATDHGDTDVDHEVDASPALSEMRAEVEVGEEVWRHYITRKRSNKTNH